MSAAPEVADVFRAGADDFLRRYGKVLLPDQHRTMRAIMRCRTPELGGEFQFCHDCGHQRIQYHSCRNRHCPKCQALARAQWVQQRESELLPIPYFHLVFTLPRQLGALALQNKRVVYGILFRAAAQTIQNLALDPKHLGARVGGLMVLHTWGQNLMHHPHVHSVVTGGGVSADGSRWVSCRMTRRQKPFFIDVKILSRVYRGKFIGMLKRAFADGDLRFHGQLTHLADRGAFENLLTTSVRTDWVVYAKRPFGGAQQVLRYLARYTHRVAISDRRLVQLKDDQVTFQYKDYSNKQRAKTMTVSTTEFIRRFLMHTLPNGFVRIRYFGFLANRYRTERLQQCRALLGVDQQPEPPTDEAIADGDSPQISAKCPACGRDRIFIVDVPPTQVYRPPHFTLRRPLPLTGRSPPPKR